MKTKIIIIISILLILTINVNAITVEYTPLKETNNYWELINLIDEYTLKKEEIHNNANNARLIGYTDDSDVIMNLKGKWHFYNEIIKFYQNQLDKVDKELDGLEYKDATLIWEYMKNLSWNDYVCAGILGNMMAEVGGGTLDLQTTIYGNGFYGLCQWNQVFTDRVWGADLKGQMDFLRDDIKYQIDMFGFCYSDEFNFEKFLELENEQEAALAFMKCYERGLPQSNYVRQQYATIAYEYFVQRR